MNKSVRIETPNQIYLSTPQSSWLSSFLYDKDQRFVVVTGCNKDTLKPVVYTYSEVSSQIFSEVEDKILRNESAGAVFNHLIKKLCPLMK